MIKNKFQIVQIDQKLQKLKIERSELMGLNSMKSTGLRFLIFLLLICGQTLIPYGSGQAWGSADTLQPVEDGYKVEWTHVGCFSPSYYQCVDDPPGSPDSTVTYAYISGAVAKEEYFRVDSTFVSDIDSVIIRINAKKTGAGTAKLYVGWVYFTEGFWLWWTDDSATLTTSWADYSANLNNDPSWAYQEINARRFGVKYIPYWGDLDTIRQDNFDDNSLDGNFWAEACEGTDAGCDVCASLNCPDNDLKEQNNRLESLPYDNSHCGAWVVSDSSAYVREAIYNWEFKWQTTATCTEITNIGRDGFFIVPQSWSQQTNYGDPQAGVHFLMGCECGNINDGILIQANDDANGWECDWDVIVAENTNDWIVKDTWYDVRIHFNGITGLCSLIVGDSLVTGTLTSTYLNYLGDSIKFVWGSSYYANDTEGKEDYMDDFLFTRKLYGIENQLTQVFVIAYTAEAVAKKQGGIVQDKDSKGIAEGGIAR
jgi:hypothetical protein